MSNRVTTLKIKRGGPGEPARHDRFDVAFEPGQSVLDALRWIRSRQDPSLAVRFSCINANACKECVIRIDGRNAYACTTRLREGEMVLEPLINKTLIRDLVVDTVAPDERLEPGGENS